MGWIRRVDPLKTPFVAGGWNFKPTNSRVPTSPNPPATSVGGDGSARWVAIKKTLFFTFYLFIRHNKFCHFLLHIVEKKKSFKLYSI